MNKEKIKELVEKFNLKNDLTANFNIWVGHAKIGYRNRMTIEQAKSLLISYFEEFIEEGEPTPENLKRTLAQWENFHPYQRVRAEDQPMFLTRKDGHIFVAVIWPWQIKDGVASLMLYEGKIID